MIETLSPGLAVMQVIQAVDDLAQALMTTPAYRALQGAADRVQNDPVVRAAIRALESKQAEVEKAQRSGRFDPAAWRELQRLRDTFEAQPAVVAYRQAEAELVALCREVNHVISHAMGLDFAANAQRSSCCG